MTRKIETVSIIGAGVIGAIQCVLALVCGGA